MSSNTNPVFNNQVSTNQPGTYIVTDRLKTIIVKQLQGKTVKEQEAIIETFLQLLDVNLLAALYMAYGAAQIGEKKEGTE